jgi:ectoine hydroxylase-related dioxygenase (phytanoyl-CoA dioxygenase family)
MYLNKTQENNLGIALHQDTHYIPNTPNTLLACWIALSDTDETNGGLFVVPGKVY